MQREKIAIELRIVPESGFSAGAQAEIPRQLHKFMGDAMRIDVEVVEQIPMVRTGKRTGVISYLDFDFQRLADSETPDA